MPQLEQSATFISQVFWLVVTFSVLLIVMWRVALPRVSALLRDRQERIDGDIERAQRLKVEAETVLASYEQAMAEGRSKAQTTLREAAERAAKEAADAQAQAAARLDRETKEAERRIDAARKAALESVSQVASEAARAAAARLIGTEVGASEADEATARAIAGRSA